MRKPNVLAKIYLSNIGYQIDIQDYRLATLDGFPIEATTICRDFGGTYDPKEISPFIVLALNT